MVRIRFAIDLHYELTVPGADFVFNIHAAHTHCQQIVDERLQISQPLLTDIQSVTRDVRGRVRRSRYLVHLTTTFGSEKAPI
jgi:hypothetical protein